MKKLLILLIILFSHPSIGYETYCDTLTANEKKRFDFCLAQDNISDDTSSGNYYRDALMNGNKAYNNGNLERALFLWEICANQYNPSKYQETCRKNISYVTSIANSKTTVVEREVVINNNNDAKFETQANIILSGGIVKPK
jgi:hypothetical protein